MARQRRFCLPGQPQHVIQRGNNRDITFIDKQDYYFYLESLTDACQKHDPVRAGIVTRPALYAWSSFRHNGLGKPDPLLTEHPLYQNLAVDRAKRLSRYRALFDTPVSRTTLSEIREATNKAWVLGNDRFREQMEEMLERQAAPRLRGGDRKSGQYRERSRINRV